MEIECARARAGVSHDKPIILTGYAVEVLERDADGTALQSLQALLGEMASLGGDFGKHELWAR